MTIHLRNCAVTVSLMGAALTLASCAYRLPAFAPPSQGLIRIVGDAPEQYSVQVNTGTVKEYDVPHDGRIKVGIPAYRPSCGVYLFNAMKVGGADDPLGTWAIPVTSGGRTLRKLSVRQMKKLTTDLDGYRLLKLS